MKFLILLLILPLNAFSFKYETVVSGQEIIWSMAFIENEIMFTERRGRLKVYNPITKKARIIKGTPKVYARGQGGLLDVKLHPDFSKNKRVYLTYSISLKDGDRTTALGFGIYDGKSLNDFKEIFVAIGESSKRHHFGSRIQFDENNNIYMTVGDRGIRPNGQDLMTHFGSVLKLDGNGNAAAGNPFIGQKGKLAAIWSYGHRNGQGLYYDKDSKVLYEMEHGPRGGDEINIITPGANYGWPIVSHGKEYTLPLWVGDYREKNAKMVDSIKYYAPSIAPSDLLMYKGDKYPKLKGSLVVGALAESHLHIYNLKTKKELKLFDDDDLRIRAVTVSNDGYIYFAADDGVIRKLLN